jgi:hypothetical protein
VANLFFLISKDGEKNPLKSQIFLFVPFPGEEKNSPEKN